MELNSEIWSQLSQVGVAGILLTLWLKMWFDHMKSKRNASNEFELPASVEKPLALLVENQSRQTEILTRQSEILRRMEEDQKEIVRHVHRIDSRMPNGRA